MTTPTSNLVNSSVSLLSNNNEKASKLQKKIREQAKLQIFESLDFDKKKVSDIEKTISELKEIEKDNTKSIAYRPKGIKFDTLKAKSPYDKIFEEYKDAKKEDKELMYMKIGERIILDRY